jgi:hypothetical protein
LSGLQPEDPPLREPLEEQPEKRSWAMERGDADVALPPIGSSRKEFDYIEALFDFRTLSRWW